MFRLFSFTVWFFIFASLAWHRGFAGDPQGPENQFHFEVIDDPPIHTIGPRPVAPPVRVFRNGFTSVQVNVDSGGNNILGDAANEPSIAVDPLDPNRIVIGWRQFDTVASNFRQAGWAFSHDGGQTWTFPGSIDAGVFRSDPVLDVDSNGVFYYNSLTTVGNDFLCTVFRSTDGGQTWDGGTFAQGGDKQWMVIDRTGGIGEGNIYAAWNISFSFCAGDFTRSVDGGDSYPECPAMPGSPRWGTMTVGPEGEVYIGGNGPEVAKSSTIQDAGTIPQFDFSRNVNLGGSLSPGAPFNPEGLTGQVEVATDHSGGPNRGNVYMAASVNPPGGDPLDVMFSRSTDGGDNWSAPIRVNDDPAGTNAWQWFATLSVAPDGRIDLVWNDTRNDPGGFDSELFYAYSLDGGLSWLGNVAVGPAFDPTLGWPQQQKIGDYYDTVSDNGGVNVAYAATFNGEQDVYFLRIEPGLLCPGDATGNGTIDLDDLLAWADRWRLPGNPGDLDGSGRVDIVDFLALLAVFGPCP